MCNRGDLLKAKAIQEGNRVLFFDYGKQQKYENAGELFRSAGNAYKLSNQWEDAGQMFLQASNSYCIINSSTDITTNLIDSAECYKQVNILESINMYRKAIDQYIQQFNFRMSSKYTKEIAELYELDNNYEDAIVAYQEASDLFMKASNALHSKQCLLKLANVLTKTNTDFNRASNIYETIGKESMNNNINQYSVKGYFFDCLLCHLAIGDTVQTKLKLESFKNLCHSFTGSYECNFIEKILDACDNMNVEDFSVACFEYDRVKPLEPNKTNMLLRCKQFIIDQLNEDDVDLS